jgi:hypothetical protein
MVRRCCSCVVLGVFVVLALAAYAWGQNPQPAKAAAPVTQSVPAGTKWGQCRFVSTPASSTLVNCLESASITEEMTRTLPPSQSASQAVTDGAGNALLSPVSGKITLAGLGAFVELAAAQPSPAGTPPSVTLTWTASSSASVCSSTGTPACTLGYNVLRGTSAGQESATPLNSTPLTALTFTDSTVVLPAGASPAAYFYVVEAVETVGGVTGNPSGPSNEVSGTFPGTPAAPAGATAVTVQ